MTHPTPEDWMAHLYGETPAARRAALDSHLQQCASCAARVQDWRSGMASLDQWELPSAPRNPVARPFLRWAAAAAVILVLGFVCGRFSAGNTRAAQAALQKDFEFRLAQAREELRAAAATETQRALELFAQAIEEKRAGDTATIVAALRQVDDRFAANLARLRRDLDTVAVVADGRLSDTQEQLYQLSSANRLDGRLQSDNDHE